jgi:hypothetical protein
MAHWRKLHESTSHFDAVASRVVGTAVLLGTLALIARHVYI